MSQIRPILEALARDELLDITDSLELSVPDRRRKALLVEAIEGVRFDLREVLLGFSRDRLKELCRMLGLDDSGREKAVLVERLMGEGGGQAAAVDEAPPSSGRRERARANGNGGQMEIAFGETLTTEKLERHLWSAADILRGSIDSADYKNYIFGLLFLKRLSDRFEEETEALRNVPGADPEDPDEHDFFVPKKARWREIQKTATGF